MPGCGTTRPKRLERHLNSHSELSKGEREAYLSKVKRQHAIKQLRELQATNPEPPMAMTLDLAEPD